MSINIPSKTVFFTIEKTIKSYRKFCQKNISKVVDDITIDQKLILQYINAYPDLNQKEIAELVFKDNASMTRMVDSMVKKKYLKRSMNVKDRRRYKIEIPPKGKDILDKLAPIIVDNRAKAFAGIPEQELVQLEKTLNKILSNIN